MDIVIGQVVIAKAGRDQNKPFAVIKIIDNRFCMIADGKRRPIEHPKLKNIIHLQKTNTVIAIETNRQLRKTLSQFEQPRLLNK